MTDDAPDLPDIFAYLDHRAFLREWFEAKKSRNSRFSHRLFARLAGQKSPSLLLAVMQGKRNLTPATVEGFLDALKLSRDEGAFFRALVDLGQAETDDERNDAWERIGAARRFREARRIEGDGFRYLSHWYYPAIRELVGRDDFQADPRWIARTLRPVITEAQAARALEDLTVLGLVAEEDGRLQVADGSVVTPREVEGLAVHNYHRGMIDRAREAISGFEPSERHLLGVTAAIPEALVPALKDELNRFQARLLDLCDSAEGTRDRVVQLNLHLFPLSDVREGA